MNPKLYISREIGKLLCGIISLFVVCCTPEDDGRMENAQTVVYISLNTASRSINEDKIRWEDRVDEVRMIAFKSQTGEAVYNGMLNFPKGMKERSEAVRMIPGTYDFYFFANESAYGTSFKDALASVTVKSNFQTDARFSNLQYNASFSPQQTGDANKFLMSAIYNNIAVNVGGTEENPTPLAVPGGEVELIRALAKVNITFRKKVSGSNIPQNLIKSVSLNKVARNFSVPPVDNVYTGQTTSSNTIVPSNFNYSNDSIGAVVFFITEFLRSNGGTDYTELHINDKTYPVRSDEQLEGLTDQRRTTNGFSNYSVIRNYNYQINVLINAQGGIEIQACVQPWKKDSFKYSYYGDTDIELPPVSHSDSTLIIPTDCGKIEMKYVNESLPQGLQGAYGDQVIWWDPVLQGPTIKKGSPPYYCEKKYGKGWRLMNACELMSFLALFDKTYKIWESNTWEGRNNNLPFFPVAFRREAQSLLEKLSGQDLSRFVLSDDGVDPMGDEKLGIIDQYFTPGDIMPREMDYPNGWPYSSPPNNQGLKWFPSEVSLQVHGYWYKNYVNYSDRNNWNKILYDEFYRYDYSRTLSRCVRQVE